jgi:hypothetical protein
MKKYVLLLLISTITLNFVSAQDADDKPKIHKPSSKQERIIFNFMLDSWMKMPQGISTQWLKSRSFEFYFMTDHSFANGHLGIAYGIGISCTNVNSNATPVQTNNATILTAIPDSVQYNQNKLSTNYIEIPLELRFRTSHIHNGNRIKIAVGAKVGYLMQDHIKFETDYLKEKVYNTPNIDSWRFCATGRIGYGKFSFTGFYALNTLFKANSSGVIPIGIGIAFSPRFGGVSE